MFRYRNAAGGAIGIAARGRPVLPAVAGPQRAADPGCGGALQPELFVTDLSPRCPSPPAVGRPADERRQPAPFQPLLGAGLALGLAVLCRFVGQYIHWAMGRPQIAVVSTFCPEYLRPTADNAVVVDAVIRPAVAALPPSRRRLRVGLCPRQHSRAAAGLPGQAGPALRGLRCCGRPDAGTGSNAGPCRRSSCTIWPAVVRGLDGGPPTDLGSLLPGKPMLAIPEPGQYEQYVNAFYLERLGGGQRCDLGALGRAWCKTLRTPPCSPRARPCPAAHRKWPDHSRPNCSRHRRCPPPTPAQEGYA